MLVIADGGRHGSETAETVGVSSAPAVAAGVSRTCSWRSERAVLRRSWSLRVAAVRQGCAVHGAGDDLEPGAPGRKSNAAFSYGSVHLCVFDCGCLPRSG